MSTDSHSNSSIELASGLTGEIIRNFGEVRLCAFGTSMAPAILPGDFLVIQLAGIGEIALGEVVLFSQDGRLFIHRVVDRKVSYARGIGEQPCLITRGDRLLHDDPAVSSHHLLGRVICVERGRRKIQLQARPTGTNRWVDRLLRASDRATYLYLRLAACWRVIHV